jgi:hypothetical protein
MHAVPYFPAAQLPTAMSSFASFPGFDEKEKAAIRHGNALAIFPRIAEKLKHRKKHQK